jgi:dipeptidase D
MIIGSAGGLDITAEIEYKEVETDSEDQAVKITVDGLRGGHSGIEIGLGHANANKLMARIAVDIIANTEARLATWAGGNMRNAIPRTCEAVFTLPAENVAELKAIVAEYAETFVNEYKGIESNIVVTTEDVETPATQIPKEIQDNVVNAINACHNGVLRYIPSIPEIVETSSNLAIINIGNGKAAIKILARSASESQKDCLANMLESCFCMAGMKVTFSGEYQGWDPNPDSEMIKVMADIYKREFGNEATVSVVHAGLECSVILSKYPGLDIVSFGPTLQHPHTPQERCEISTMPKFWQLLKCALEEVPEK